MTFKSNSELHTKSKETDTEKMLLEAQREKVRNELIAEMKKTATVELEVKDRDKTIKLKDT